jgi:hypothetical protein
MHKTFLLAIMLLFSLVSRAMATKEIFVDFDDLTVGTMYNVGDSFRSDGIDFNVIDFSGTGSSITVNQYSEALRKNLVMNTAIGVEIELPRNTTLLEFDFLGCPFCTTTGLDVNGESSLPTPMTALNGRTLAGVAVQQSGGIRGVGRIRFEGPITSFSVGGNGLSIYNLRIVTPEPATCLLLGASLMTLTLRRSR